jgi:DNA-damage-inducible protein D
LGKEILMPNEIETHPSYIQSISRLEAIKRVSEQGIEYWMARDINMLLGYPTWREFESVIERARSAMTANGIDPSHQVVLTHKLMEVGGGAQKRGDDYFLTRGACRLIAMNGDPSKPEIAGAQSYFVVQTHRMEQQDSLNDDEKRLQLRQRVTSAFKVVSGVAQEAGVTGSKQPIFHDARYQGLYGMSRRDVMTRKGLKKDDNPFDFAGPLELSANEFQMNLAADVIQKEGIKGEYNVIAKNKAIAQDVRKTIKDSKGTLPENLPIAEPIRQVEKRVKEMKKKLLTRP